MVYITGDKHTNFKNMKTKLFDMDIKKEDTFIILGDLGVNYSVERIKDGLYEDTIHSLIDKNRLIKAFTETGNEIPNILVIQGNHEAPAWCVKDYEEKKWNGGMVYIQPEFPKLMFAYEGEIFSIEGHTYLTIGGAYSVDKFYRLQRGLKWFPEEQLTDKEKKKILKRIKNLKNVDIVLSHTVPERYIPKDLFLSAVDQSTVDNSMEEFLTKVDKQLDYKKWYAGHYHADRKIKVDKNTEFYILYESIECPFQERRY